jgi:glyoxylase-like metal-dependent hydrolase (beta-lactamase superfamily II)
MEVAQSIHRIDTDFGGRVNAAYLLIGERTMLVDTTTKDSAPDVLGYLASVDVTRLDYVVSTHADWDHVAGNGTVREAFPTATFMCHRDDQTMVEDIDVMISARYGEYAQDHGFDETDESKAIIRRSASTTTMDITVTSDTQVRLAEDWFVTLVHTPGHSRGSLSVLDPRSNSAIIGDAVLGSAVPLANGAPAFPPTYRYVDPYLDSIQTLQKHAPSFLLTSHYATMDQAAASAFLEESARFVDQVEEAVADHLGTSNKPTTLLALCEAISPKLGDWPSTAAPALVYPVLGHLERMIDRGQLRSDRQGDAVGFTVTSPND